MATVNANNIYGRFWKEQLVTRRKKQQNSGMINTLVGNIRLRKLLLAKQKQVILAHTVVDVIYSFRKCMCARLLSHNDRSFFFFVFLWLANCDRVLVQTLTTISSSHRKKRISWHHCVVEKYFHARSSLTQTDSRHFSWMWTLLCLGSLSSWKISTTCQS